MGQYFKVVNLDKRQYFSPGIFNGAVKIRVATEGIYSYVLARLLVLNEDETNEIGGWAGDRIAIVGDESGRNFFGLINVEDQEKYVLLNNLVIEEFENIGAKLFCTCIDDEYFCEFILNQLKEDKSYFGRVGYLVYKHPDISSNLNSFLKEHFGDDWEKEAGKVWEDKKSTFIELDT